MPEDESRSTVGRTEPVEHSLAKHRGSLAVVARRGIFVIVVIEPTMEAEAREQVGRVDESSGLPTRRAQDLRNQRGVEAAIGVFGIGTVNAGETSRVTIEAWEGRVQGEGATAVSNTMPSWANRSSAGLVCRSAP